MKHSKFPKEWDEEKVHKVLDHYEKQTEEESLAEVGAAYEDRTQTTIDIPVEFVPAVRELIARYQTSQHSKITLDKEYQEIFNTSKRTASRDLLDLLDPLSLGFFELIGTTGTGTFYILKGPNLDNGVVVNYAMFESLLKKVR